MGAFPLRAQPVEEIVEGIKNGVRKINIDTDLRMASKHPVNRKSGAPPRAGWAEVANAEDAELIW